MAKRKRAVAVSYDFQGNSVNPQQDPALNFQPINLNTGNGQQVQMRLGEQRDPAPQFQPIQQPQQQGWARNPDGSFAMNTQYLNQQAGGVRGFDAYNPIQNTNRSYAYEGTYGNRRMEDGGWIPPQPTYENYYNPYYLGEMRQAPQAPEFGYNEVNPEQDLANAQIGQATPSVETPKTEFKGSFGQAFKEARKTLGAGQTFTWRGKQYVTDVAKEAGNTRSATVKAATPKKQQVSQADKKAYEDFMGSSQVYGNSGYQDPNAPVYATGYTPNPEMQQFQPINQAQFNQGNFDPTGRTKDEEAYLYSQAQGAVQPDITNMSGQQVWDGTSDVRNAALMSLPFGSIVRYSRLPSMIGQGVRTANQAQRVLNAGNRGLNSGQAQRVIEGAKKALPEGRRTVSEWANRMKPTSQSGQGSFTDWLRRFGTEPMENGGQFNNPYVDNRQPFNYGSSANYAQYVQDPNQFQMQQQPQPMAQEQPNPRQRNKSVAGGIQQGAELVGDVFRGIKNFQDNIILGGGTLLNGLLQDNHNVRDRVVPMADPTLQYQPQFNNMMQNGGQMPQQGMVVNTAWQPNAILDMTPKEVQDLRNSGYEFEIID